MTSQGADHGLRPLCFVLMPFGVKPDGTGRSVDFDRLYRDVILPAAEEAGMEPIRADEERDGGLIHKAMLERLVLCPFAVADLTLANANVFYELGVRHAVRPFTTVLMYRVGGERLPFDVAPLRALPYSVDAGGGVTDLVELRGAVAERLDVARDPAADSPLFQLLEGFGPPDIARLKTDVFRERVRYHEEIKESLRRARSGPDAPEKVAEVHDRLRPLVSREAGVMIDLMLSYREVDDFAAMVSVVHEMSQPVAQSVLVQEQLAWALNRLGRDDEAERILTRLLARSGPSSETLGLLGRLYKDRWERARRVGSPAAAGYLRKAIDAYRRGYERDWRDAYPGVNAISLLEIQHPGHPDVAELLPVVRYAAKRRVDAGEDDYWDRATLLELAVLSRQSDDQIRPLLEDALAARPARWKAESTAHNLALLLESRTVAGEDVTRLERLHADLVRSFSDTS